MNDTRELDFMLVRIFVLLNRINKETTPFVVEFDYIIHEKVVKLIMVN